MKLLPQYFTCEKIPPRRIQIDIITVAAAICIPFGLTW